MYPQSSLPRIVTPVVSTIPPWSGLQSRIVHDFPVDTVTSEYFERYTRQEFSNFVTLYTDGSKTLDPQVSVAAAFYYPTWDVGVSWLLHPEHSVLSAELFGLLKCLEFVEQLNTSRCVIFTDSLTSLQLLGSNSKTYINTVDKIKERILSANSERTVLLHWVKAHVGIHGNERADRAANLGHKNVKSTLFPLQCEEILCTLRRNFFSNWQRYWRESCRTQRKGLFLHSIRETITKESVIDTGSRKLDCVLYRLRLGRVPLNDYLFRIRKSETDQCSHCGALENLEHYILECDWYSGERYP